MILICPCVIIFSASNISFPHTIIIRGNTMSLAANMFYSRDWNITHGYKLLLAGIKSALWWHLGASVLYSLVFRLLLPNGKSFFEIHVYWLLYAIIQMKATRGFCSIRHCSETPCLRIDYFSAAQSFWNFAQNRALLLSYSVQSRKLWT